MPNKVQVIFEVDKDAQGRTTLKQIESGITRLGRASQGAGAQIEAGLSFVKSAVLVEFFRRGAQAALDFGVAAVKAFTEANNAALGLQSVAKFKGLDPADTVEQVKNLDLVRNGLLTVGEASTALKNLLQAGFGIDQSIELIKRFGDSAAFGKQAALSFGQAVVSTSEGVRNQNCVTAETLVLTTEGEVSIREIVDGKLSPLVISFDKESLQYCVKSITGLARNGVREVYELSLSDGRHIKATPNHRFMTSEGMKFLFEINEGDEVYTWSETACDAKKNLSSHQTESTQRNIAVKNAQINIDRLRKHANVAEANIQSKIAGLKKLVSAQENVIFSQIETLESQGLRQQSHAEFAVNPLSNLLDISGRDLAIFAQKSAGQETKVKTLAEKIALGMLNTQRLLASGVVSHFDCRLASQKRRAFVLRLAAMNGKVKCVCAAKITQDGMAERQGGAKPLCQQESTRIGERRSSEEILMHVSDAEINGEETYMPIISNPLLSILNWQQWKRTESRFAKIATPKRIKKCRPLKVRVSKIERVGFEQVYDLEIEDTHTFIGNGFLQSNSILSDNGGITKNLSVILKERGFELQDLSDKVKGAAAREALYNGLLVETQAQVGDAIKLAQTFAGEQAKLEAQQQKLLVTLGELITKNPELGKALQTVSSTLEYLTAQLKDSDSELSKFVNNSVNSFATLIDTAAKLARGLGAILTIVNAFPDVGKVLNPGATLFAPTKDQAKQEADTKAQFAKLREVYLAEQKKLEAELKAKPILSAESISAGQKTTDAINRANDAYFKKIDESNKKFAEGLREIGNATTDLQAKLSINPVATAFEAAEVSRRAFIEKLRDVPKEFRDAFEKASRDVQALDLFKGVLGQSQALASTRLQLAELEAGGDPKKLAQARREAVQQEIDAAKKFLDIAANPAQRQLAIGRIVEGTRNVGELTPEQRDVRFRALNEQVTVQEQLFRENFNRLTAQTNATNDNTAALVQVGNRLEQVDGALSNFKEGAIIKIVDESNGAASVNLGSV